MAVESKKMLAANPAGKTSVLEAFFKETKIDGAKTPSCNFNNLHFFGEIPIYNVRWYPNSRSCIKISSEHRKPQNTPPLMVRKAEWRR